LFAGLCVEFVDRGRALEQVRELGEKSSGTCPISAIFEEFPDQGLIPSSTHIEFAEHFLEEAKKYIE